MSEKNKPKLTPVFDNLESAFKTWWKNLNKFVSIYLWGLTYALIPVAVIALLVGLKFWLGNQLDLTFDIAGLILLVACLLSLIYFAIRTYISLFLLVKGDYAGKGHMLFKESKKYFWPYLAVVVPMAVLTLFWTFLLIIPGIIFAVFYGLTVFVFFFEDKRELDALSGSKKLIEGYWWPVFGRYLLIGLIAIVFSALITWPISGKDISQSSAFFQIWNFIVQIINYLVGPIYLIYVYNIYQDLVKIKK